jgi:hypothetical protein
MGDVAFGAIAEWALNSVNPIAALTLNSRNSKLFRLGFLPGRDVPHSGISIGAHVHVMSLDDVAVHQHGAELRDQ